MQNKLLPCPFCGKEIDIEYNSDGFYCSTCCCFRIENYSGSGTNAFDNFIEKWNTRTESQVDRYKTALSESIADINFALYNISKFQPETAKEKLKELRLKITQALDKKELKKTEELKDKQVSPLPLK